MFKFIGLDKFELNTSDLTNNLYGNLQNVQNFIFSTSSSNTQTHQPSTITTGFSNDQEYTSDNNNNNNRVLLGSKAVQAKSDETQAAAANHRPNPISSARRRQLPPPPVITPTTQQKQTGINQRSAPITANNTNNNNQFLNRTPDKFNSGSPSNNSNLVASGGGQNRASINRVQPFIRPARKKEGVSVPAATIASVTKNPYANSTSTSNDQQQFNSNTSTNLNSNNYYRSGTPTLPTETKAKPANRIFSQVKVPPIINTNKTTETTKPGTSNYEVEENLAIDRYQQQQPQPDGSDFDSFSYNSRPSSSSTQTQHVRPRHRKFPKPDAGANSSLNNRRPSKMSNSISSKVPTPTITTTAEREILNINTEAEPQQPSFLLKDNYLYDSYESSSFSIPKRRWLRAYDMVKRQLPGVSCNFFIFAFFFCFSKHLIIMGDFGFARCCIKLIESNLAIK